MASRQMLALRSISYDAELAYLLARTIALANDAFRMRLAKPMCYKAEEIGDTDLASS